MQCRICYGEEGEVIYPCKCTAPVHEACLSKWLHISGRDSCEVCLHSFEVYEEVVDYYDDTDMFVPLFYVCIVLSFFCAQFGILMLFPLWVNSILVISNICQILMCCVCLVVEVNCLDCLLVLKISAMMSFVLYDIVKHTRSIGFYVEMIGFICLILPWFCYFRSSSRVRAYLQ